MVLAGWTCDDHSFDPSLFSCSTPARAWVTKATFRDLLSPRVQWAIPHRLSRALSITNLISLIGTEGPARLHSERNGLEARRLQQYEVHNDEKTKNTNYDAELKFMMIKGKLHSLKTSPIPAPSPSLYCHKGDSCEVFFPSCSCMCSIVVTLMNPSDLNPALNFFNLLEFWRIPGAPSLCCSDCHKSVFSISLMGF